MKNLKILLLSLLLIITYSIPVLAGNQSTSTIIEIFDDGSYIETMLCEELTVTPFSTSSTKSGSKTTNYKNSSGKTIWTITVNGTFSYDGSSAKCTTASISTTCPNENWKLSNKTVTKSGATATASVTAKKYIDSICVKTISNSVILTCSKTGTLS
jgi:hypothetical protein